MPGLIVNLSDDEAAAVQWLAAQRGVTSSQLLRKAFSAELDGYMRLYRERVWMVRRKALEANASLAAQVDAAAETP